MLLCATPQALGIQILIIKTTLINKFPWVGVPRLMGHRSLDGCCERQGQPQKGPSRRVTGSDLRVRAKDWGWGEAGFWGPSEKSRTPRPG